MNIIIFGTGLFYKNRRHMLPSETNIIAFLDNNHALHGKILDGVKILSPFDVQTLEFEAVVMASASSGEMKEQLIDLGVKREKILFWEEFISKYTHGILTKYEPDSSQCSLKTEKVLIIVPHLNYAGGFLAALNMGFCLRNSGLCVVIASPMNNEKVVKDIINEGISVWICPSLPYITKTEQSWINQFEYVICNSLQTIICATMIKKGKRILFWLHEHSKQYPEILNQYSEYCDFSYLNQINVCTVSGLAQKNFKKYFPDVSTQILPVCIQDFARKYTEKKDKIIIVLLGSIYPLKNQLGFVEAINGIQEEYKERIECLIIGRNANKDYQMILEREIRSIPNIRMMDEIPAKQLHDLYNEIDIVVCASQEETMSMTIIEGLMCGKICITNTNTGIADYLKDGQNGFVYGVGNNKQLKEKIEYTISNFDTLDYIRRNARRTYEEYFTINHLQKNLDTILGL